MREISFVKRLKFNFPGSVAKRALVIGDADNDQRTELVCANLQGELAIFKGRDKDKFAYATDLGMVTACVVGDILNTGQNYVAAINMEGWLFVFHIDASNKTNQTSISFNRPEINSESIAITTRSSDTNRASTDSPQGEHSALKLFPIYDQRMPANCKELLLADLDGDGQNEVIIGLTDRVLRTYKWIKIDSDKGKFVGLYKWEFADQIGAVSLNTSRHDNCQDIIVAQPGGTYAKLECFDKKPSLNSMSTSSSSNEPTGQQTGEDLGAQNISISSASGDNVRTEYISKLTPEYHQLALAQMRNHHISTEVLGGIRDGKNSSSYSSIVIATLDGTLMLVNKNEILWSLQVDHQLFALSLLETTRRNDSHLTQSESTCTIVPNLDFSDNLSRRQDLYKKKPTQQYFVACAWNGKTYIIDEERNYLRFKIDEAVSAFTAGNFYFDGRDRPSLVYATFNNQIILYYDVILDQIRPVYLRDEICNNPTNSNIKRSLEILHKRLNPGFGSGSLHAEPNDSESMSDSQMYDLLRDLLYNVTDEELGI